MKAQHDIKAAMLSIEATSATRAIMQKHGNTLNGDHTAKLHRSIMKQLACSTMVAKVGGVYTAYSLN